jgi:hypothetical protein
VYAWAQILIPLVPCVCPSVGAFFPWFCYGCQFYTDINWSLRLLPRLAWQRDSILSEEPASSIFQKDGSRTWKFSILKIIFSERLTREFRKLVVCNLLWWHDPWLTRFREHDILASSHSMEQNFNAVDLLNKYVRNKFDQVHLNDI